MGLGGRRREGRGRRREGGGREEGLGGGGRKGRREEAEK